MSSFLFEKEEINCNCFDNSPKNAPRIFRTDPYHSNKTNEKEIKETSLRNNSEQGKHKKKSLRKEKNLSNFGSEKDPKEKEETANVIFVPDIQTAFSSNQIRKEQKLITFEQHFDQPPFIPIKSERIKHVNNWRLQKPQTLFEPLEFEFNHKKEPIIQTITHSERKINDEEYDQKISEEFERDLREFKLEMQNLESKNVHNKHHSKRRKDSTIGVKNQIEKLTLNEPSYEARYSATEHLIPVFDNDKSSSRVVTFRNSAVSNKEKLSIKKEKNRIQPKEIESEKDSNSEASSDRLSEVVGRGWDGLTEKRISLYENDEGEKKEKTRMETMATQESNINCSQVNTFTGFSNIMTSPKSANNRGMAFGGGHKYGLTGLSFQQLDSMRQAKGTLSSKVIL